MRALQQGFNGVAEIAYRRQAGDARTTLQGVQGAQQACHVRDFRRLGMPLSQHAISVVENFARFFAEDFQQIGIDVAEAHQIASRNGVDRFVCDFGFRDEFLFVRGLGLRYGHLFVRNRNNVFNFGNRLFVDRFVSGDIFDRMLEFGRMLERSPARRQVSLQQADRALALPGWRAARRTLRLRC